MKYPLGLCVAAMMLWASRADAQSNDSEARARFTRGVQLIQEARWQDAIRELDAARSLHNTASVMFNLGLAHRAVGHNLAGIAAFREFERMAGSNLDADRRRETEDYISQLSAALARVQIVVEPNNAVITVDDVVQHDTTVTTDPGAHRLVVTANGFEPQSREFTAQPGEHTRMQIALNALDLRGFLHVECNASHASIRIDGRDFGSNPVDQRVAPGRHTVDITAPNRIAFHRALVVEPSEHVRLPATLAARGGSILSSPLLWIGAIVVVGGAVTAVSFVALSHSEEPYVGGLGVATDALTIRR